MYRDHKPYLYSCVSTQKLGGPVLSATRETDNSVLLHVRIVGDDIYQRQGDNIITWTEPPSKEGKDAVELALSFQDDVGCKEIW